MAAAKGNQFWKLRSRHGREKIFKTPGILWEAACEYFQWCEDNPLIEIDFRGKELEEVELPKMRAFTMEGLCHFLHVNTRYFSEFERDIAKKKDNTSKDFSAVIIDIKETVHRQKFEGAAAGFLNANLISRDLGLKDKTEVEHSGAVDVSQTQYKIQRRKK